MGPIDIGRKGYGSAPAEAKRQSARRWVNLPLKTAVTPKNQGLRPPIPGTNRLKMRIISSIL
jgi:hypothetical protein